MGMEGGCYCGALRYEVTGDPVFRGQCHCRECQYISGGNPNVIMGMPTAGFRYSKGSPKSFTRSDLERPVTRESAREQAETVVAAEQAERTVGSLAVEFV